MGISVKELRGRRTKWFVAVAVLIMVLCLFGVLLMNNQRAMQRMKQEEAELRVRLSMSQSEEQKLKVQLSGVGSISNLDSEARALSFVKPGEIRFEIENAQLLDKYTEAEWRIMMEERKLGSY